MNRADLIVVLTLVAMACIALSWGARADPWARDYAGECQSRARMIERIEAIPELEREWSTWAGQVDARTLRYVLYARHWLAAGLNSRQAWSSCPSL